MTGYIYFNDAGTQKQRDTIMKQGGTLGAVSLTNYTCRIEDSEDVIVYIKDNNKVEQTYSGQTHTYKGTTYYLLGKGATSINTGRFRICYVIKENGTLTDKYLFDSKYDLYTADDNNIYATSATTVGSSWDHFISWGGTVLLSYNGKNFTGVNVGSSTVQLKNDTTTPVVIGISNQLVSDGNNLNFLCQNTGSYSPDSFNNIQDRNVPYLYSAYWYGHKDYTGADVESLRAWWLANIYPNPTYKPIEDDFLCNDGDPLFLNIHTTHSLQEAQKYLSDGTLPSDDGYVPSDDGIPPTEHDSGGDDDDMDGMNNTDHTPTQSILTSPTNKYYILEYNGLNTFCDWFWNGILTQITSDYTTLGDYAVNLLTGAYGDLNKYVVGLRKLNVNIDTFFERSTAQHIQLGRYTLDNFECDGIKSDKQSMPLLAEYRIPMRHSTSNKPTHGNFLDYPPYTSVSIYIPFIGIVPIDGNMVVGRTIRIYGAVDVIAGTIHYNVFVQTPSKDWSLIGSYEGKCGVDIPLALDNSMQNSTNILKMAADVTMGICTKNPSSLLNVGNGIFTEPINNLGAQTTNTTYYNPNSCALIMQSAIGFIPDNYGRTVGYMWGKSSKLSELSGLTICKNPRIGNFDDNTPTDSEREEIYSLLQSGVII